MTASRTSRGSSTPEPFHRPPFHRRAPSPHLCSGHPERLRAAATLWTARAVATRSARSRHGPTSDVTERPDRPGSDPRRATRRRSSATGGPFCCQEQRGSGLRERTELVAKGRGQDKMDLADPAYHPRARCKSSCQGVYKFHPFCESSCHFPMRSSASQTRSHGHTCLWLGFRTRGGKSRRIKNLQWEVREGGRNVHGKLMRKEDRFFVLLQKTEDPGNQFISFKLLQSSNILPTAFPHSW